MSEDEVLTETEGRTAGDTMLLNEDEGDDAQGEKAVTEMVPLLLPAKT